MKKQKNDEILKNAQGFDTVGEYLKTAIKKYSKNKAFIIKNKEGKKVTYTDITYEKYGKDMQALGTALIDLGLENKRIAIIGKNSYEWALTYTTVMTGVGITVPLDKGLQENEIIMSIQRSKADAIVFEKEYIEVINKIKEENDTNLKYFICMNSNENKENLYLYDLIKKGTEKVKSKDARFEKHKVNPDEMSSIVFTSGTTSSSKAVMLSSRNIASDIYYMNQVEKFYDTDVNMAFLPFHHTFGSTAIILFLSHGITNVFCDGLRHIQENLKEYKVTVFVCVPLLLEAIYKKIMEQVKKQGKANLIKFARKLSRFLLKFNIDIRRKLFKQILDELGGNIRFVVSGAAALDKDVSEGLNDFGILAVQGYGLTETSPVVTAEDEYHLRSGSIGLPLPGVEVKIHNPDENGIGEIAAKGKNVMLGYYEMEEETNKVLKDGWFYTGDLGYIDKDGYVFITGRQKNVIVLKNGKNIYPEEIEALIVKLPYVAEVMAFGKEKDEDLLLSVKIVYNEDYVKQNYPGMSEEEFKKIVWEDMKKINKTLPKYKYIKNLILTNEPMVKTTTAKIKRFEEIKKENQK